MESSLLRFPAKDKGPAVVKFRQHRQRRIYRAACGAALSDGARRGGHQLSRQITFRRAGPKSSTAL
jgi:hypothetical protein